MKNLNYFNLPGNMENMGNMIGIFIALILADLCLKGWSMWRAARMEKKYWFIALLIVNSVGILPAVFLLITKNEYASLQKSHQNAPSQM